MIPLQDASDTYAIQRNAPADRLVLIEFVKKDCGPCALMAPVLNALADEYAGKAVFCKLDVDDAPDVAMHYHVSAFPTLLFVKNSDVITSISGRRPGAVIKQMIEENL